MFSEQFFDLLLNFGDDWKVDEVKVNFLSEEVDVYVSFIGGKAECPESLEMCPVYDPQGDSQVAPSGYDAVQDLHQLPGAQGEVVPGHQDRQGALGGRLRTPHLPVRTFGDRPAQGYQEPDANGTTAAVRLQRGQPYHPPLGRAGHGKAPAGRSLHALEHRREVLQKGT